MPEIDFNNPNMLLSFYLMAMEELIVAIEEQICLPRKISVMQLFSVWANMEPIYA